MKFPAYQVTCSNCTLVCTLYHCPFHIPSHIPLCLTSQWSAHSPPKWKSYCWFPHRQQWPLELLSRKYTHLQLLGQSLVCRSCPWWWMSHCRWGPCSRRQRAAAAAVAAGEPSQRWAEETGAWWSQAVTTVWGRARVYLWKLKYMYAQYMYMYIHVNV